MAIKVGHRGAAGYEPENTLRSFQKALKLGVDMIELDVHLCKSGELVVRHEYFVDGTQNGRNFISEKTLPELKELNMGQGEKIPTLNEVLDLIDRKAKVNVELKGRNTAKLVSDLVEEYVKNKKWEYDDFLVSSFLYDELKKIKELNQKIKIGVLTINAPESFFRFAREIHAYSLNVPMEKLTKKFVDKAREEGFKVYVFWTPNTVEDIKKAKKIGADYICSNFPDKI